MQKKKLKLEELKVQSFITELKPNVANTAVGGDDSGLDCVNQSVNISKVIVDISHALTAWPQSCVAANCAPQQPPQQQPQPPNNGGGYPGDEGMSSF